MRVRVEYMNETDSFKVDLTVPGEKPPEGKEVTYTFFLDNGPQLYVLKDALALAQEHYGNGDYVCTIDHED